MILVLGLTILPGMSENPYRASEEPIKAELATPQRQFPPIGYMFIAAVLWSQTFMSAWFGIPASFSGSDWTMFAISAGVAAISFVLASLATMPVHRWFLTGRYH